jgi:predicted RNase H-like nuclease
LDLIVKYKKGIRRERAAELSRLRELMLSRLPVMDPPLRLDLPAVPGVGSLKPLEDQIDAVMCAYIGAYWWFWGRQRSRLYGDEKSGYIVVPERQTAPVPAAARAITRQ